MLTPCHCIGTTQTVSTLPPRVRSPKPIQGGSGQEDTMETETERQSTETEKDTTADNGDTTTEREATVTERETTTDTSED